MAPQLKVILILAVLFGGLVLALEVGFRAGRRAARVEDDPAGAQLAAVQGALFGLLALLLGLSFAGAAARFLEKQDLIVEEANAIGTAALRADLLDEPHRSDLRSALKRYTEVRLAASAKLRQGLDPGLLAEMERLHGDIWRAAAAGVTARPEWSEVMLDPVSAVIELHSTRLAAGKKRMPALVLGLLFACSMLSMAVIGFPCGVARRRYAPMTVSLALLIGATLWLMIDLDHQRMGLIRLSDAPLEALSFDPP